MLWGVWYIFFRVVSVGIMSHIMSHHDNKVIIAYQIMEVVM